MIVPQYWAEAKSKNTINGKQVTVKRFGWSDISEADAQNNAVSRLDEAVSRIKSGEKLRKVDHKVAYNGAEGLPIREEIISRHGDSVITRNSYGAMCLNTPDILFADIDFKNEPGFKLNSLAFLLLAGVAIAIGLYQKSALAILIFLVFAILFITPLAAGLLKLMTVGKGGAANIALKTIRKFSENNPDWHLRIYRTPMGYRILVMHKTFYPNADETLNFFQEVNVDPVYIRMCKNQKCFRARLSPKPWRIGIDRLKPRPGVWPIKPERMADREKWVEDYDKKSVDYAACQFIEKLGSDLADPKAEVIKSLHDGLCQSDKALALA